MDIFGGMNIYAGNRSGRTEAWVNVLTPVLMSPVCVDRI